MGLTLLYFKFVLNVDRLTSSELVLSNEDVINIKLNGGTSSLGEAVDTYKGVRIYEYDDELVYALCYVAKGKVIPCDKMSEDDIDGTFTGDINGYYDKSTAYFKRVKLGRISRFIYSRRFDKLSDRRFGSAVWLSFVRGNACIAGQTGNEMSFVR